MLPGQDRLLQKKALAEENSQSAFFYFKIVLKAKPRTARAGCADRYPRSYC